MASSPEVKGDTKRVVVTGGNSGIGLALCTQLVRDYGCYVYLGARDAAKGAAAVADIEAAAGGAVSPGGGGVECVLMDVTDEDTIVAAAAAVARALPAGESLYAVVNNAGTGFAHNVPPAVIIDTNLHGPKRVVDAFLPLLQDGARIVNVGSGGGPEHVARQPQHVRRRFVDPASWQEIQELGRYSGTCPVEAYGVSKALLASYTVLLAREHLGIVCSCLNPGFIQSGLSAGYGATLTPEQGTVALKHCLFADLGPKESGRFYESDGTPAPLDDGRDARTYEAPLNS